MTVIYVLLSVTGWVWLTVAAGLLWYRLRALGDESTTEARGE